MKYKIEVALQDETDYPHVGHHRLRRADAEHDHRHPGGPRRPAESEAACCCRDISCASAFRRPVEELALLVPDVALGSDQGGRYVLVREQRQRGRAAQGRDRPAGRQHAGDRQGSDRERPGGGRGHCCARSPGRRSIRKPLLKKPPPLASARARTSGRAMISKFFIERPVLANVIAILMVVIGLVALINLPVAQYPDITPPTVQVTTRYPGRQRAHGHRHGRAADRAAGQRRRRHDLHAVVLHRRRQLHAHSDVQDRHRPQLRAGAGAEPGRDRACRAAAGGAGAGRRHPEEVDGDPPDHRADVARRQLRQPLSRELRDHPAQGRARRGSPASATSTCSAPASTPCGSGSIPRSCRRAD